MKKRAPAVAYACFEREIQMGPLLFEVLRRIDHARSCGEKEALLFRPVEAISEAGVKARVSPLARPIHVGGKGLDEDREPRVVPECPLQEVGELGEIVIPPPFDLAEVQVRVERCDPVPDRNGLVLWPMPAQPGRLPEASRSGTDASCRSFCSAHSRNVCLAKQIGFGLSAPSRIGPSTAMRRDMLLPIGRPQLICVREHRYDG